MHDTMPHDASLHVYMRLSITYSRGAGPSTATTVTVSVLYDLILTSVREQT